MKKTLQKIIMEDKEFFSIIQDIIDNTTVQQMKEYKQHYETNCYDHCLVASYYCFKICKKFNLDYKSATRAAMLHDLFLYDWRKRQPGRKGLHAFTHGLTAYENASKLFELNELQKDMIIKHMWPVTIAFPRYKESYILTLVDKHCALAESADFLRTKIMNTKFIKKTSTILNLIKT